MELVVFDLDGTLLNGSSQISDFTRETLQLLSERNIAYTLATGRTFHSAKDIIVGHNFDLPHIYTNGVIVWDPRNENLLLDSFLSLGETGLVLEAAHQNHVATFLSTVDENSSHYIFHSMNLNVTEEKLLNNFLRRPEVKVLPIEHINENARITNISMIGSSSDIDQIQMAIQKQDHLVAYSGPAIEGDGNKWMDVHHFSASKGSAISSLREQLGVSKVICFGDSDNDLSMFATADESYAPENANAAIKSAASAIIGHHDQDGIAHFLRKRFDLPS